MARRQSFLSLIEGVRNESARSAEIAIGVADVPRLKHEINKAYERAWDMFAWPHLRHTTEKKQLLATERYYDLPSTLAYDGIEFARVWRGNTNTKVTRGIMMTDYNATDSTVVPEQVTSQVMKWDLRATDATRDEQFEVWPIPNDNEQTIQFTGRLKFVRLVNDIDLCLVDDWLIILLAAVKIIKDKDQKQVVMQQAKERFEMLIANAQSGTDDIIMSMGEPEADLFKGVTIRVS
jgi:hypothetical protein